MRAIQEEVDRAREKRLLREKGRHEFIFMLELQNNFRRDAVDQLHFDQRGQISKLVGTVLTKMCLWY